LTPRTLSPLLLLVLTVPMGACTPIRGFNGYVVDRDLAAGIQPGIDNRDSVLRTLGKPTFQSQFGGGDWYYVSRNTEQFAFRRPKAANVSNLRIRFDPNGTVASVDRTGLNQVAQISPDGDKTPTLGQERSFFEEFFGGIGSVGSGIGGARDTSNTGGGTP
jgi:outer membrane protein assembly factor BamE (lipoprotein component of BamABCDE complex)